MPENKYIGTKAASQLTGLSMQEIYDLIHCGTLSAHKAPKSGWRIPFQALAKLGLIKEQEAKSVHNVSQFEDRVSYVEDEEHYTQVLIDIIILFILLVVSIIAITIFSTESNR